MKKPPLGLVPRKHHQRLVNIKRHNDICKAIERYNKAKKEIPAEWLQELMGLTIAINLETA